MFKNIPTSHIMIGIYQIAGGIIGMAVVIGLVKSETAVFGAVLSLLLLWVAALYAYSIYCGVLLLSGNHKGLNQTQINQYLQVISILIAGFAFQYYSGIFFSVGIDLTHSFHFKLNWGLSTFQMNLISKNETVAFNVNLVALGLILYTDKLMRREKEKALKIQQQKLKKPA
jgi:hypothetical protein